ncbi:MAG: putative DsbA family oxidoreductase [Streblomastix strix]|uniref:Putative DsbA family oxidoreductase n=1 Tax=Streblomastix strix TaxID=222440 RepID=A0A5J4TDR7_9EUKA|nr:MAG: putative DsbA family oxidoreductase [Streblomastix strix]
MVKTKKIDVVSDFTCTWCEVGRNHINAALAQIDKNVEMQIIRHPFLLYDVPQGGMPASQYMMERFGKDISGLQQKIADDVAGEGINIRDRSPQMACTIDAHRLVELALDELDPQKYNELHEKLIRGYFAEKLDLNNRDILIEDVKSVGLDEANIRVMFDDGVGRQKFISKTEQAAIEKGITSVAEITIKDKYNFNGAVPTQIILSVMKMEVA